MAELVCETCHVTFSGRPNCKFCGPRCKRRAEKRARARKQKAAHDAWVASLPPEERAFWDSLPTMEEAFGDLPAADWGEPTDWEGGEAWTEEDWKSVPPW